MMEYLPLGNLKQLNESQKVSRVEAGTCLRQILEVVKYLHSQGITHRDIKPADILIQSEPPELFVELSDFGLSKEGGDYLMTHCGTSAYVAAEVFTGKYTNSVDIWSNGVATYELIEDLPRHPKEFDPKAWSEKVRRTVVRLNRRARDPISQMLKKMFQLDPNDRPPAEDRLLEPWNQSLPRFPESISDQKDRSSTESFIGEESWQSTEIQEFVTEQPTEVMDPIPEVKGQSELHGQRALKPQKRFRSSGSFPKLRTRKKGLSEVPQGAASTGDDSTV
jgi:ser/thr/tyr protein kinase RAD53